MIHSQVRRRSLSPLLTAQMQNAVATAGHAITKVTAYAAKAGDGAAGYSVLQVETNTGIRGVGECRRATAPEVQALQQAVVGKSALAYEPLTALVAPAVRGGLNMALLDIVGKVTKAPVYRVLGGPTRFKARVVARLLASEDAALREEIQQLLGKGVRAFLMPVSPPTAHNQGSLFVRKNLERFTALQASAPQAEFGLAANSQLSVGDASMLAAATESHRPLWFDHPSSIANPEALRKVCDQTVVPLAFGRGVEDPSVFQNLLREGLIDLVRPDLLEYGISGVCRIAAMAETYYVAVSPIQEAGPIATAAAVHAAASMPNFYAVEVTKDQLGSLVVKDGFFELPKGPGLGVELAEGISERNRIA